MPRSPRIRICGPGSRPPTRPRPINVWVGALAEDHVNDGFVGHLLFTILRDHFTRLRDGDRFRYQSYLPKNMVQQVQSQTLAKIIERNTPIGAELQADVFHVPDND